MPDYSFETATIAMALAAAAAFLLIMFRLSRYRITNARENHDALEMVGCRDDRTISEGARVVVASVLHPENTLQAVVAGTSQQLIELISYSSAAPAHRPGAPLRMIVISGESALEAVVPLIDLQCLSGVAKLFVGRPEWLTSLNRRKNRRLEMNCPVTIVPAGQWAVGAHEFSGWLTDLSVSGCCLASSRRMDPGSTFRINVSIVELRAHRMVGVVTGCRPVGAGRDAKYCVRCRFVEQSDLLRQSLMTLIG